jgi:hypothetical protein
MWSKPYKEFLRKFFILLVMWTDTTLMTALMKIQAGQTDSYVMVWDGMWSDRIISQHFFDENDMKIKAICSSKTLADFQQTTRHYIPEGSTLHHCREDLESYIILPFL